VEALNMSGVRDCPCCGTPVMCANEFIDELCDECWAAACNPLTPCTVICPDVHRAP